MDIYECDLCGIFTEYEIHTPTDEAFECNLCPDCFEEVAK